MKTPKKIKIENLAIYKMVKQELIDQEVSVEQLAKEAGISPFNFKRDLSSPRLTFDRVARIAGCLSIDGNQLIDGYLKEERRIKNEIKE